MVACQADRFLSGSAGVYTDNDPGTERNPMRDESDFTRLTEPFRKELLAHCYRMLASYDEAEDLVQETYLRAWRSFGTFEGRSSVRVWLYRIATNACLTALDNRKRRPLPSGLGAPSNDPYGEPAAAGPDIEWLQPIPDALVTPADQDPAMVAATRDGLRLALVASLQRLPPKQRAVLILREVLAFSANEVAVMLGTTHTAVKSSLQRARANLGDPQPTDLAGDLDERRLLEQYIYGFENADLAVLEQALRQDASLEMVGTTTWFDGRKTCVPYLANVIGQPGDWRMVPTRANGQPAVVSYYRGEPFGLAVLDIRVDGLKGIAVFAGSDLVTSFSPSAA
ncbi:RNA polymerase subunit sigma-70 [Kribbella deserti]|uniref:RNA polymerase subunit sigma-70 n=1 Tax=Kribbella deserti TaxID=1926257 RepID=A0ABV6QQ41_9ACTN